MTQYHSVPGIQPYIYMDVSLCRSIDLSLFISLVLSLSLLPSRSSCSHCFCLIDIKDMCIILWPGTFQFWHQHERHIIVHQIPFSHHQRWVQNDININWTFYLCFIYCSFIFFNEEISTKELFDNTKTQLCPHINHWQCDWLYVYMGNWKAKNRWRYVWLVW